VIITGYLKGFIGWVGVGLMAAACATSEFSKEKPPHYAYKESHIERPAPGSLWKDSAGLFEDRKARTVNDLVTIKIVESTSASNSSATGTSRDSSMDDKVTNFFGLPLSYNLENILGKGVAGVYLTPTVSGSSKSDFAGKGNTTRAGSFVATITARVVEVLPNGNFVIESRKDIKLNREKEVLILRGVIRPEDIASDNTIASGYIANAQLTYTGDGVIADKQGQGWLVRLMDWVWPF
jgi:flagellar L-ring protein FlgH